MNEQGNPDIHIRLLRHAKAAHNEAIQGTWAGRELDHPLSPEGKHTALRHAERILAMPDRQIALIVHSFLLRSEQTAVIIQTKLNQSGKHVPRIQSATIAEASVGAFQGLTEEEVRRRFPTHAASLYDSPLEGLTFPGGEDYEQIRQRARKFLDELAANVQVASGDIVVVGHGIFNRVLLNDLARVSAPELAVRLKQCAHTVAYPQDRVFELILHRANGQWHLVGFEVEEA